MGDAARGYQRPAVSHLICGLLRASGGQPEDLACIPCRSRTSGLLGNAAAGWRTAHDRARQTEDGGGLAGGGSHCL